MGLGNPSRQVLLALRILVFLACLLPLAWLVWATWQDALGANPIEAITHATGEWTLRFLLASLALTPLRRVTGLDWLIRLRRMLGLYAFFYGVLHLVTYMWLDQFFDWRAMLHDVGRRPFITVGLAALVVMLPLAATSFGAAMRWLGGRRWRLLHRLAYVAALCSVLHYWWLVKIDISWPLLYAAILAVLLAARLRFPRRKVT